VIFFRGTGIAEVGFELRGVNTYHPSFQQQPFDMTYLGSVWSCSICIRLSVWGGVIDVSTSREGMIQEGMFVGW
jgi:hypothetical protein